MTQPSSDAVAHDARFEALCEQVAEAMRRLRVPGAAVGLMHQGREYTAGFGVTNVDCPASVSAKTLFQIGSITKTVTATAAMRLVEAGTLALDTPIRTYLPDLRLADESVAARVTLRHLLTHTAGWEGDFGLMEDTGRGDDALARYVASLSQARQQTPLGTVWSYNNAALQLAGRVIEAVTGKPYETAAHELVLAPLGMSHAYFFPEQVMLHSFVAGHNVVNDQAAVARPWPIPRNANPAGGVTTSVGDMLRYARFQMVDGTAADGTRVLSRASLDLMQSPLVEAGVRGWVGLTWFMQEWDGVRVIGHDGGTIGQIARLRLAPARDFALVMLTNASRGGALVEEVTRWAFARYLGLAEPERVPQPRTPEQLASFAGHYVSTARVVDLALREGTLTMQSHDSERVRAQMENPAPPQPPFAVAFYAEDRIVATDGPFTGDTAEFLRNQDGSIAWLRVGGRLYRHEG